MYRTYKRKLILTKTQEGRLVNWIGVCRMVYNMGLEIRIAAWRNKGYVRWLKGYAVFEKITSESSYRMSNGNGTITDIHPQWYSKIKYLDADKKELSKNIVVWMEK